ncbi:MAG: threonine dehydrogenase-like Zn-dependent dehydrogenase [Candidatus Paceibacteria bacterium]|jgi:threonine dehydrogenase-like Zn-dependent dehydrogenase
MGSQDDTVSRLPMQALHFTPTPELQANTPKPTPAEGEALIALRLAGICDTDLQLKRGYMGFLGIPGHEFVGEVIECGDSNWVGKRVVGDINAGCGECEECLNHMGHHCAARSVLGILERPGCFAEYFTLPTRNLVAVPAGVPDEAAVFAEPLAAGLHVLDCMEPSGDPHCAVLGDGKLGLLTALALHGAGVDVTLLGHHEAKLDIARAAGIEARIETGDPSEAMAFDLVVEVTGNPGGLQRALELVRPRGTLVQKSTVADKLAVDLSPLVIHEIKLVGSRCGDMQAAMDALESEKIDPSPLIVGRYPLAQALSAIEFAERRGTLKVLLEGTL